MVTLKILSTEPSVYNISDQHNDLIAKGLLLQQIIRASNFFGSMIGNSQ
ncbi:MAG: hypothetical protein LN575_06075 [Rickettsia endosymbiont of Gnoriste bilineata]|nr:hypothetical protein [Rickettsia endosymbiont of Gnoriste bilineata]